MPVGSDVIAPSDIGSVTVERACLLTWVAPCLGIVETGIDDACLVKRETLAYAIVLKDRINLGSYLLWLDINLGMNHHESAGQVAVFG